MENFDAWIGNVRMAYEIARGDRLAELRGRRPRTFDARGLHPYSEIWGQINATTSPEISEWMAAGGGDLTAISPESLRRAAVADANREFARRVADGEEAFA